MNDNYLIICDNRQKSYFSKFEEGKDFSFVTSEAEFETLRSDKKIEQYNRIIIFAELSWDGKNYSDFYGIDISIRLRMELRALAPICILSFLPKNYFNNKEEVRFNVLKVRGSAFCQLPSTFETIENSLKSIIPLHSATLAFLPLYLIEIKNLIGEITHSLRINSGTELIEKALSKIEQFAKTSIYDSLKSLADTIKSAHSNNNSEEFADAIKKLVEKLNAYQKKELSLKEQKKEKILLLEDKDEELNWARSELEKHFEVVAVKTAKDAIKEIDEDEKHNYRAIIADWELIEPDSSEHQQLLGFEVLEYASRKRIYAMFSLTVTDDYCARDVDACINFKHKIFKKEFVEEKSKALWNSYIPIIQQDVRQITELICSIPDCANWRTTTRRNQTLPSYKTQYTGKRNSADWDSFEHNISMQVNNYFEWSADESILEIREDIESLLKTRRIFYKRFFDTFLKSLGYGEKRDKIKAIENAMKEFGRSKEGDSNRNKFLSDLCLKFNDLPSVGMLPEEKAWLATQGINI